MDLFEKSFEKILNENINAKTILKKVVDKKYQDIGIKIEENKLTEIIDMLVAKQGETLNVHIEDECIVESKINHENADGEILNIEINDSDIDDVFNRVLSTLPEIYNNSVETTANGLLKNIRRKLPFILKKNKSEREIFEKELKKLWNKPIKLLEFFIFLVIDIGANFNNHYGKIALKKNDVVFEVLLRLFARSCQIASEILVLLKAGFPDGAHARWRTLHEIAVVAMFIDKHGDEVAKRYLLHEYVEDYKGAVQHQHFCESTNNIPLTDEEFEEIETNYQNVINRFGSDFRGDYGWASRILNNKKPNFSDIEKDVQLDKWRPDYKLASHNVHANSMGLSFKLGRLPGDSKSLLIGASMIGIDEAGQGTAVSLLKVITTLLFRKTNMDVLISCSILMKLENEISSEFIKVRKMIEQHKESITI
ncbi:MAG TPA: DUF5677 domain-containing protein [Pyrinomonadaceae bacterium]|nr:DUF5677 domain-containing protein [Pyrinomonadaceae bacterium]